MCKPMLTICCITYNHVNFIKQALDGFLMQKTNFPIEILVHDDASDDGTTEIIQSYVSKHPGKILPVYQKENQFSKGKRVIVDFLLDKIRGKYVAFCEGDDYWTDPYKLQKQVDFLEENPDFSVCFHPVMVKWEDKSLPDSIFPTSEYIDNKNELTLDDLLKKNFIQTNSVVYRWQLKREEWPTEEFLPEDYLYHLIHAQKGKIGFLPDVMAVYRKHPGGIWSGCGRTDDWFVRCGVKHARFYQIIHKMYNIPVEDSVRSLVQSTVLALIKSRTYGKLDSIYKEFPSVYNDYIAKIEEIPINAARLVNLQQENNDLCTRNSGLTIQNSDLSVKNTELTVKNTELESSNEMLKRIVKRVRKKKQLLLYAIFIMLILYAFLLTFLFVDVWK